MPHALFLGSHLATQDRISDAPRDLDLPAAPAHAPRRSIKAIFCKLFRVSRLDIEDKGLDLSTPYGIRENNALSFIKGHLVHALADIICSLLGFAVAINSA